MDEILRTAEVQMRFVKHGFLLLGVAASLAAASFAGTLGSVAPATGDGTAVTDDDGYVGANSFARVTGLHW